MSEEKYPKKIIPSSDSILRRIPIAHYQYCEVLGRKRISSSAFTLSSLEKSGDSQPGISADWKEEITANKINHLERHKSSYSDVLLGELKVEDVRKIVADTPDTYLSVEHDPLSPPKEDNPFHTQIYHPDAKKKDLTGRQKKALASLCKIVYNPEDSN